MTVVAVVTVPIVLLYQGWTYWVFRHRLDPEHFGSPLDRLAGRKSPGDEAGPADRPLDETARPASP